MIAAQLIRTVSGLIVISAMFIMAKQLTRVVPSAPPMSIQPPLPAGSTRENSRERARERARWLEDSLRESEAERDRLAHGGMRFDAGRPMIDPSRDDD